MIDLVIVRAPHQILYSIERLKNSKLKNVLVLDMFQDQNVSNTINQLLDNKKWDRIIKLNYRANDACGKLKYILFLIITKILSFSRIKINNLIIGDGNIIFAKLILDNFKYIKRTIVIGDGTDFIITNKTTKEIRYHCHIGRKARGILKSLNLKFSDEYNYDELFTYFKVGDPRLRVNDFSVLRGSIEHNNNYVDHATVYFLGTILLDRFSEKEVEEIYVDIFSRYPADLVKYIPHRREASEQIEILRSVSNATVIENRSQIIETFFIANNIIPIRLGSFTSNAVFSLITIYRELNIDLFHLIRKTRNYKVGTIEDRIREFVENDYLNKRVKSHVIHI